MAEDEMVGWHHQLNGYEFEQAPGDREQGSLVCCSSWVAKSRTQLSDPTTSPVGLPWWLSGKESTCNAGATGDKGLISGF